MSARTISYSFIAIVLVMVCVGGCNLGSSGSNDGSATELNAGEFEVTDILVNSNRTDTQIYVGSSVPVLITIESQGRSSGVELEIKLFSLADGVLVDSYKGNVDQSAFDGQVFELASSQPWKAGRYLTEVTVDGKLVGHRELDIAENPSLSLE